MKAYVVDSAAVRSNLQQLQTRAGSAVLWAVLKGDGYGLGLLPMAAICREAGVTHFAVTEVSEVSRLRAGGFADASILMLRPTSEQDELRQLLQLGAILTVSSQNDAAVLNGVAQELGVQAEVHVKIDTGMGRYGFLPDELDQLLPIFRYMPGLHVTGIYTHLHSAFCSQKATIAQAEAMEQAGISFDAVVAIEIPDEKIVARMGGRRVCENCGASYHIVNIPPKKEGVCDVCGGKLVQRKDDNPETVRDRLAVYHKETEPLKGFYEARGILKTVEDQPTVAGTTQAILKALGR